MIEFTDTEVMNWAGAIRGMRNSWESHEKSDSEWKDIWSSDEIYLGLRYILGPNDLKLAKQLSKAGSSHSKFMRQILVCVDINAPLYWWKEFDQYKVGTVTNSESTMHMLSRKPITKEMFSLNFIDGWEEAIADASLENIECLRELYLKTKDKRYWKLLIQLLPSGWMQKRTTTLNYAVIKNAYHDRKSHKLSEWHDFCTWAKSLPYSELIVGEKNEKAD